MTICPGQDTRYWRPEDVFEIPCGQCAGAVEFFKDDVRRRCKRCGAVVQNPKITRGCAQWCEHAKACLGYDPNETSLEEGNGQSRLEQLIVEAQTLGLDKEQTEFNLAVAEEARHLLQEERAHQPVVLAAALLQNLPGPIEQQQETISKLMTELGFDSATLSSVCALLAGKEPPEATPEGRVLHDAHRLAMLASANVPGTGDGAWHTEAARQRAQDFQRRESTG